MCQSLNQAADCNCDDCEPAGSMVEAIPVDQIPFGAERKPRLGDTVTGTYHDVPFTGVLHSYDGSGYAYVRFPAPLAQPVVFGEARDGIGIHPSQRDFRVVSRPSIPPEVKVASYAAMGGCYIV